MTGVLTMLAGASGAGKSALADRRWPSVQVFARDWARQVVGGGADDVSPPVLGDADDLLEAIAGMRLHRGAATVIDSSGTAPGLLDRFLALGRAYGARCELLIVDAPLALCLSRQTLRPVLRRVPEADVCRQYAAVTELIAKYSGGPAPWDDVRVVSGTGPLPGRPA